MLLPNVYLVHLSNVPRNDHDIVFYNIKVIDYILKREGGTYVCVRACVCVYACMGTSSQSINYLWFFILVTNILGA